MRIGIGQIASSKFRQSLPLFLPLPSNVSRVRRNLKLSPRYYGPYTITKRIGKVAYHLDLPPDSQIFPVFHVSCLKKTLGEQIHPSTKLLRLTLEGHLAPELEVILDRRIIKKGRRAGVEMLVKWKGAMEDDSTWVELDDLKRQFPDLKGKVF
ncbi:hypothetical protein Patl1_12025 [Pistacia atlantica]|uniref:Uncharacterized protein n=1 Tax=Pistacia atlantica TaxID=434234 RepID=A0ACC1A9W5_9ROSI|nr:hypothetical protein Patl1_12025 [Pistacia atlantica]